MKVQRLLIAAVAIALATTAQAQVKVGANPGTLSTNAVLDVEGTSGTHAVMLQNGNFGIGTAAPGVKLQVEGAESQFTNGTSKWALAPTAGGSTGASNSFEIVDRISNVRRMIFNDNGNAYLGGTIINNTGSGAPLSIVGGNVGIGTVTPGSTRLLVLAPAGVGGVAITGPATASVSIPFIVTADATSNNGQVIGRFTSLQSSNTGFMDIGRTSGQALIQSYTNAIAPNNLLLNPNGGNVGVGTTTPGSKLDVVGGGANNFALNVTNPTGGGIITNVTTGQYAITILNSGTEVGRVTANASSTTYGTTSDIRLKENIKATHYSLADLMKIQVKDYNYKTDPKKEAQTGFLAQQLYTVFPNAVSVGGEDATKKPWNVDYGKVTPLLVKAVQELNAKVEALEKENSSLKAQANEVASLRSELDDIKALVLKGSPAQKVNSVTKR